MAIFVPYEYTYIILRYACVFSIIKSIMSIKKKHLITLLHNLQGKRDLASGFLLMFKHNLVTDEVLEGLYTIMSNIVKSSVKSTYDEAQREILTKSMIMIQKIQSIEQQEDDTSDIDAELDAMLADL